MGTSHSAPTVPLCINGRTRFDRAVVGAQGSPLAGASLRTVQVNIGLVCNLACRHCHVESGPKRTEEMSWETMGLVLDAARRCGAETLDITGGAPEMNPHFRRLVDDALAMRLHVMVRTNLTIMLEEGYTDLPEWFAARRVHLIASLPCYLETNVDRQRGRGVYHESIDVIRGLNALGYGRRDDLPLDLVYNPGGPSLPPAQSALEVDYKRELGQRYGIEFTRLICITNIAIGRFLHDLEREGKAADYERTLREAFNPATLDGLMCRHQLHVSHDGTLHDCDFNYALGLASDARSAGHRPHIADFDPERYRTRRIVTGEHCYACTAGAGSSCGGAVV